MKILIACEFSGIVRNAFLDKGHSFLTKALSITDNLIDEKNTTV